MKSMILVDSFVNFSDYTLRGKLVDKMFTLYERQLACASLMKRNGRLNQVFTQIRYNI
jgi:hypothetical protein